MNYKHLVLFLISTFSMSLSYIKAEDLDLRNRGILHVQDTARNEIVYVHIAIDPEKNNERKVTYEMLTFGNRLSHYGGYEDYQLDSLYMSNPSLHLDPQESYNLYKQYDTIRDSMTTDRHNGTLTFYGSIFINYYRYTEPIPEIEWELHNDSTEVVLGYECRKATAKWRGREWTAWYSDIPEDAGPWKFQGLPGLILKLEDSSGQHYFEAIGIKNDVFPFGYKDHLYSRTTREKLAKNMEEYAANFGRMIADSGMILESDDHLEKLRKSKRRKFYAPIELE